MKIQSLILITIITILLIVNVDASGISPGKLDFNLKVGERGCQNVTVFSSSVNLTVFDNWASDKNVAWNLVLFETDKSVHGLSIVYSAKSSSSGRKTEICVSGTKVGEYHGIAIFKDDQVGTAIIQVGVWLNVTIISGGSVITPPNANNPPVTTPSSKEDKWNLITPDNRANEKNNPSKLFDIKLELEDITLNRANELVSIITFASFGNVPTSVDLTYSILDSSGKEVYSEKGSVTVTTEQIVRKNFENLDLPDGKYILVLTTVYGDNVKDEFRQVFEVGKAGVLQSINNNWILFTIIIGGVIILFIIFIIVYKFYKKIDIKNMDINPSEKNRILK